MAEQKNTSFLGAVSDDLTKAHNLELKTEMMVALRDIINQHGWDQKTTGENLGMSQPRVSNFFNGHIDLCSIDSLMAMFVKLGFSFKLNCTGADKGEPNISVDVSKANSFFINQKSKD